jgi:hypothetical protein
VVDIKSERRDMRPNPSMARQAFAEPSGYVNVPTVTRTSRGNFDGPSRPDMYPQYTSSPSTSSDRNLLSFVGGSGNSQSQTMSPGGTPSFSRPPAQNLYYNPFPPTYLISNSRSLENGFPVVLPPSPVQPHPFTSHDVNEADWTR